MTIACRQNIWRFSVRACDLDGKNIVIWGTGKEGRAAASFLLRRLRNPKIVFADEDEGPSEEEGFHVVREPGTIADAFEKADAVIKSPGVSLYHPLVEKTKNRGTLVTSLLNLWLAEPHTTKVICVTGTKGKSTTASLIAHALKAFGEKVALAGNIGVPVTDIVETEADFAIVEVSSYQAADMERECDLGILVSLYPEHLDWHRSLDAYFRDKINLLRHSRVKVINAETVREIDERLVREAIAFNDRKGLHAGKGSIYSGEMRIGIVANSYLARPHNLSNVCAALTALEQLGFDVKKALRNMEDFRGLPHRQQELGEKDGVLYVDDSISTTPQSAVAAMDIYFDRPVTLIAGGFDRGIDYAPLVDSIIKREINAVICMGPSGERIASFLKKAGFDRVFLADSMKEAVDISRRKTPPGGVVLLSPAAPSYGLFRDFTERGKAFASASGFGKNESEEGSGKDNPANAG